MIIDLKEYQKGNDSDVWVRDEIKDFVVEMYQKQLDVSHTTDDVIYVTVLLISMWLNGFKEAFGEEFSLNVEGTFVEYFEWRRDNR